MSAAVERPDGASFAGVSFAYPGDTTAVLDDVSCRIDEGAFVVVAGESGCGKSTLLRCLNGLVPHFSGGRFGGSVHVGALDTRLHGPRALSTSVGFVFQDPEAQRVTSLVEDEIAFGMEQLGVPPLTMRKRVEEVLDLLGIAALRHRDPETLSGGERQRVAVAAALAQQPRMLVLDEPTSQLDPWGAEDVVAALERLNQDLGLTVVIAEHRLERVLSPADRMLAFLPSGTVVDGTPRDMVRLLDDQLLPPLAQLGRALEWVPQPLTIKEGRAAVRDMTVRPISPPPIPEFTTGDAVVDVRGLVAGYGRRQVLAGIDLMVRQGEIVAVMGRNGSGKTTLLRTLMGFHRPARGAVRVGGVDAGTAAPHQIARHAGYLPQRPSQLLFMPTLADELTFTLRHRPEAGRDPDRLLAELDLLPAKDRNPRDLSVGEQERAALAAVLVGSPAVLLLDEPTRGMDGRRKRVLAEFLRRRQAEGVAVVIATHDMELVAETATRVVLLGDGEVVADGSPRAVLSGSLTFATQINKLFGGEFLTPNDVLASLHAPVASGDTPVR